MYIGCNNKTQYALYYTLSDVSKKNNTVSIAVDMKFIKIKLLCSLLHSCIDLKLPKF